MASKPPTKAVITKYIAATKDIKATTYIGGLSLETEAGKWCDFTKDGIALCPTNILAAKIIINRTKNLIFCVNILISAQMAEFM